MPAQVSHYRVLRKLGAGGMGEVFLAEDLNLDRRVALKFLPASSSADDSARKRLIREAHAAAALDHPNICAIYEVGQDNGRDFIAMQFVDGETLAARMAVGPLEMREATALAAQIAEALAEAHSRGVVHRDIKPQNIMITPRGQAKVMDFGLAKLVGAGRSEAETESRMTRPGAVVGTAAYMSPEQVSGELVDARSDIFALGAVLYEMLSRVRPFDSATIQETFAAILMRDPPPLSGAAEEIPPELQRIVSKALRKKKEERYQSAEALANDLRNVADQLRLKRGAVSHRRWWGGRVAALGATLLVVIVAGVAAMLWKSRQGLTEELRPGDIRSLAVLPLENLSADPDQAYFADGMTEALITELAKIRTLRVISRTSTSRYRRTEKPLPEIGRELGADAIIEGSVGRAGDQVRITAQLVHAPTDRHLWADSYQRDLKDVFRLQSEVARAIATQIGLTLTPGEQEQLSGAGPVNPEANEAYLRGLYYFDRAINEPTTAVRKELHEKSFAYYQKAIQIDPDFAPAWARLAQSYHWLASIEFPEFYPKAKAAALKAIEIDESNALAHGALAFTIQQLEWDWTGAEREYKRAIELNPSLGNTGHHGYALLMSALGRHQEAIAAIKKAEELDPLTLPLKSNMGLIYRHARQHDRAIAQYRKLLELNPNDASVLARLASVYQDKKMYDQAISHFQKALAAGGSRRIEGLLAQAHAAKGDRARALEILNRLQQLPDSQPSVRLRFVAIYGALGENDRAFAILEQEYQARNPSLGYLKVSPDFDSLRSDPRFQDIVRRMGFP